MRLIARLPQVTSHDFGFCTPMPACSPETFSQVLLSAPDRLCRISFPLTLAQSIYAASKAPMRIDWLEFQPALFRLPILDRASAPGNSYRRETWGLPPRPVSGQDQCPRNNERRV